MKKIKKLLEAFYVNYLLWRLSGLKQFKKQINDEINYIERYCYTTENIDYLEKQIKNIDTTMSKILNKLQKTSVW